MSGLAAPRTLRQDELSLPGALPGFPLVFERAANDDTSLAGLLARHGDAIRASWRDAGALLFRGFDIDSPEAFELSLGALGLTVSPDYPFGVSPRPSVTKRVFKSTEYANFLVIIPHTEMAYLRWRPRWISFYCETPPERFGETPLYDMVRALEFLPPALAARFKSTQMRYVRHIRHKAAIVKFERTIVETFGTTDRAEIERACKALTITPSWIEDKFLVAETVLPAVVAHPDTGQPCLNAQFINQDALISALDMIRDRYSPLLLPLFKAYIRHQFRKPTVHYRSTPIPGPDFTGDDMAAINDAMHRAATVFRWRKGDVMLIDNIRAAHGRLNVKGPRRILTALGDFYDALSLGKADAARTGERAAQPAEAVARRA